MGNLFLRVIRILSLAFCLSSLNLNAQDVNPREVADLLNRILCQSPTSNSQLPITFELCNLATLRPCDSAPKDIFIITSKDDKPCVRGNSILAITTGINWYLNHYAHINISWSQLKIDDIENYEFPIPEKEELHVCDADYRYYLNYCTFSYSMSVWTWERWEQEIDWMALHGINMPLQIVGLDVVWMRLLTEHYGYTKDEANEFIAGPCFQAWWGMNNLEGWGGKNPDWWYKRQASLAKKICNRMRELGMQPVLPGFSGMVPSDFTDKTGISSNSQGLWCGFKRPHILNPNTEDFKIMAERYYKILEEVMGTSTYYSMDPFHEGANTDGIDVPAAYKAIADAMYEANDDIDEKWVIQYWQWNADQYHVLDYVKKGDLIILDLFSTAHTHFQEYKGHDAVYCMLPNFGGRSGFMGRFNGVIEGYFENKKMHLNIKGVGATPESIGSVPVLYDILFELPWHETKPDAKEWMRNYTISRYGVESTLAQGAWELLRNSALNCETALQGPQEAVTCARPSLNVDRVSSWGGTEIFYDAKDVAEAARKLLEADLEGENYYYDLVDVWRQAMTDKAYYLLKEISSLYQMPELVEGMTSNNLISTDSITGGISDSLTFIKKRDEFLKLINDLDRLLNTNKHFMLGTWTEMARAIADEVEGTTESDRDWLELNNARTLITTWGDEVNANQGGLRDYSYRQWGGMMKDFYLPRWQYFFNNNMASPPEGWFEMERKWALDKSLRYSDKPQGNTKDVIRSVIEKSL